MQLPEPLLAIDGGTVGVIVFLTISFISWIMNTIQASQAKQKAEERRRRQQERQDGGEPDPVRGQARPERPKSEIEAFLEEVTAQKQQQRVEPEPPRPAQPRRMGERAGGEPRRPQPVRQEQPPRPPAPRRQTKPPQLPEQKQPRPAQPKPGGERELGSVKDHVTTYMSSRIEDHVQRDIAAHVDQHIDDHVDQHIGRETVTDDQIRSVAPSKDAAQIREMLKDVAGVRQAIMVSEILKRRTFKR